MHNTYAGRRNIANTATNNPTTINPGDADLAARNIKAFLKFLGEVIKKAVAMIASIFNFVIHSVISITTKRARKKAADYLSEHKGDICQQLLNSIDNQNYTGYNPELIEYLKAATQADNKILYIKKNNLIDAYINGVKKGSISSSFAVRELENRAKSQRIREK